jgi:hypothetical protein
LIASWTPNNTITAIATTTNQIKSLRRFESLVAVPVTAGSGLCCCGCGAGTGWRLERVGVGDCAGVVVVPNGYCDHSCFTPGGVDPRPACAGGAARTTATRAAAAINLGFTAFRCRAAQSMHRLCSVRAHQ